MCGVWPLHIAVLVWTLVCKVSERQGFKAVQVSSGML